MRRLPHWRMIVPVAFAALAVGCGTEPPVTDLPASYPTPRPSVMPLLPPPPTHEAGLVRALLGNIARTKQSFNGLDGQVKTYEDGPRGTITETLKITFKKPSNLRIEVLESSGGNAGTKLLWKGGDELKVKPSYLPFAVSIKMSDDRLLSKNGWEIRQTDVNSVLEVLLSPASRIRPIGEQTLGGKPLIMLEVLSPLTPKGATREVIGIDRRTNLPGVRLIYRGQKLIYRLTIDRLVPSTPSSKDLDI